MQLLLGGNMKRRVVPSLWVLFYCLWSLGLLTELQAQEPYYKGKTIKIVVGFTPGGFYDRWARLFSRYMQPNEVLTEIRVPLPTSGSGTAYAKLPHPASGYVVVSAGVLITRQASGSCSFARVVLGGLGSGPMRAAVTEAELQGKALTPEVIASAAAMAAQNTDPIDDTYASADYKRQVATVYARRAIEAAVKRAVG